MITRRDLFKFAGVGAAALLVPTTTFFLPPRCGWGAQRLRIRRVEQYLINTDEFAWRYDATWDTPNDGPRQYWVHFREIPPCDEAFILHQNDKIARETLERAMHTDHGTANSPYMKLALPRSVERAEYI